MTGTGLLSKLTVGVVGLTSKAFLNLGFGSSITINGIQHLYTALESKERTTGRGIVTVANHISTLDDPLVWGILPARFFFSHRTTRWTLGASDIMFTNPMFSLFFREGQVLETFRGNGIFQAAIDTAIRKLNEGEWIHLFGEGKVNQTTSSEKHELLRFKWGVGRILMEAMKPPVIIPMWLEGFDKMMPEGRSAPWKFLPRPGVKLSVTFGKPVDNGEIREVLRSAVELGQLHDVSQTENGNLSASQRLDEEMRSADSSSSGWLKGIANSPETSTAEGRERAMKLANVRSTVTAIIQRDVQALGNEIMARRISEHLRG